MASRPAKRARDDANTPSTLDEQERLHQTQAQFYINAQYAQRAAHAAAAADAGRRGLPAPPPPPQMLDLETLAALRRQLGGPHDLPLVAARPSIPAVADLPARLAAHHSTRVAKASSVARTLVIGGLAEQAIVAAVAKLPIATVRDELVEASLVVPEVAEALELVRISPLDAIDDATAVQLLGEAASRWPAIAARLAPAQTAAQDMAEDLSFVIDVRRIIHADDRLRESQKFDRGAETAERVGSMIERVMEAMERCPTKHQAERVMEALETIGDEIIGGHGETGRALLGGGGATRPLERALERMIVVLDELDILADFQEAYEHICGLYSDHGLDDIGDLRTRVTQLLEAKERAE